MTLHDPKAGFTPIVTEARARHATATSIPIAVERFINGTYLRHSVRLTAYGDPPDEWWQRLANELLFALVPTAELYDPRSELSVGVRIDKKTRETHLTIQIAPPGRRRELGQPQLPAHSPLRPGRRRSFR